MVTVYEKKTGKPHKCEPVDARELVDSGAYVKKVEEESSGPKEGTKEWICEQLENAGVEFDSSAKKADLQEILDGLSEE
jgi:hypothetical protein